ncbi:MAG: bacillithiol biosynthesis cysteine-adding enzyme BshC, partial [Bacteroidota bacterium]
VINTCKELKQAYPEYEFVPIYWMASEDHDFEEISYFRLNGKKLVWDTEQSGAVGRMDPSALLEMAKSLPKGAEFFEEAYSQPTLADAARSYVNHLFGEHGLVVIDADNRELKQSLIPVIEDDLFTHSTEKLVNKTSSELENAGCKAQVNARQVNFFFLKDEVRERIERIEEGFEVVDTDMRFSDAEMKQLITEHPEQFSPNVLLRPLYQEMILPNLSYVGGPSELLYWLQFKSVFDRFQVSFPILQPRNFGLIVPKSAETKWEKTGLTSKELFLDGEKAFTQWVEKNSNNGLSFSEDLESLKGLETELKKKAEKVDPTLVQHIESLHATFSKRLEKAEKKLVRSEKRKHQEKRQQIESVKDTLFPGGTLQERKDNFLNFYLKDSTFTKSLLDTFEPFEFKMYLIPE